LSDGAAERERDARAIADFLLGEGKISMAAQAFLRAASNAQIWQQMGMPGVSSGRFTAARSAIPRAAAARGHD
jgi:hypothetical protein